MKDNDHPACDLELGRLWLEQKIEERYNEMLRKPVKISYGSGV